MDDFPTEHYGMAKKRRPGQPHRSPVTRGEPALRLGKWLRALGETQASLAKETGIGESYISHLVSGKKVNPSDEYIRKIEGFLGVPRRYLYDDPPSAEVIDRASTLDPLVLARLRRH